MSAPHVPAESPRPGEPAALPVSEGPGGLDGLRPRLPSPLRPVDDARFERRGVRLLLKRDDLIHPALPQYKSTGVSGSGQRVSH